MASGQNEFKFSCARLAKERDRTGAETCLATVVNHLLHHFVGVFGAVQAKENLADHLLLVLREKIRQLLVHDMPVVIDLGSERMIERKYNGLLLLLAEAF